MRIPTVNAVTAGAAGIATSGAVAQFELAWPALSIGAGSVVTAGILLIGRRSGVKRYAASGGIFTLGLGIAILTTGTFPDAYGQDPLVALMALGTVSGLIAATTEAGATAIDRYAGPYAEKLFKAIAALIGLLLIIWTVLTAAEKLVRYGGVAVGGPTMLALNAVGARFPIPIWFIDGGVDAVIVVFVGCILIGFHTLELLHTGWRATKASAKKGASAGKTGIGRAKGLRKTPGEES